MKRSLLILLVTLLAAGCSQAFDDSDAAERDGSLDRGWTVDRDSDDSDSTDDPTTDDASDEDQPGADDRDEGNGKENCEGNCGIDPHDRSTWPGNWKSFERQVFRLVNERRAEGADCGEYGVQEPAPRLKHNPDLNEAAVNHSLDMALHDFLDHEGTDGARFDDRIGETDYDGVPRGENVAGGYPTPDEVVDAWMESDGHCVVVMLGDVDDIGVGYFHKSDTSYGHFWTMVVARDE